MPQHRVYRICCAHRLWWVLLLTAPAFGQVEVKGTVWEGYDLDRVPRYEVASTDSVWSVIYEGACYKGNLSRVFAYFSNPEILAGEMASDEKYPGIVLVHGGGGRAFREWVTKWAAMGYAAISMDLRGNGPNGEHIVGGFEEPDGRIPYISVAEDATEEWMFQAVANVTLAHNLLRSFGGVDRDKTAITGISWGGIITCVIAGIDHRYKALVPVYGCGFLDECHAMGRMLSNMTDADARTWVHRYDPKNYLVDCTAPVLFINGTNDNHFFLRPYAKSYALVGNKLLSIKPGLKHNHSAGWDNVEIELFVRNKLLNGAALPRFHPAERKGRQASARMDMTEEISDGYLLYTADSCCNGQERWITEKAEVAGSVIQGMLPEQQVSAWFLAMRDPLGAWISSEIKFE